MGFLARLTRSTLAVAAFAAAGVAAAAWVPPDPPHRVEPSDLITATASRLAGLPGETIDVELSVVDRFPGFQVTECTVSFPDFRGSSASCDGTNKATVKVPAGLGDVPVTWQVLGVAGPPDNRRQSEVLRPDPSDQLRGTFTFRILDSPTAGVSPEVADPGRPIAVTLRSPDQATITSCTVQLGTAAGACDGGTARLTVPADAPLGGELPLSWTFEYSFSKRSPYEKNQIITDTGSGKSDKDQVVPVAPPPPEFDVQPQTRTAAPGLPFVVVFQSLTPGVTFKDCVVTFRGKANCSPSGVVVVSIPPDTPVGDTITLHWQVFYTSTRPGERPGPVEGDLTAKVVASQPDFVVTVQPGQGEPGDEVTVSLQPVDDDVRILDCMTFFPHGPGAICQRSPERWFTRTVVPPDALPGTALLRWGVTSLTAGERRATPTGGVPFKVVKPVRPPTGNPSSKPPTGNPTANPPIGGTTTVPPISTPDTQSQTTPAGQPVFVAMTDPEGADPGQPVSVTIQPLTTGTTITGCRAAFDGSEGATCRPAGGNWTAEVTVPDNAAPGDLPLQWDVTDAGGQGGGGTINYRVLRSGVPPQVLVTLDPTKGKPGGTVKVTPHIDDATVTIIGCRAAYLPGGQLAECHNDGQGWVADVALPKDAPAGSATLFWRVAYARSGDNGATDGNVTIPVVADQQSGWDTLAGFLWPRGAGVLGLVTALAVAAFQGWRRRQRSVQRDRDDDPAAGISVDVVRQHGAAAATTADEDAPPRLVVRLTLHRGAPYIRGEGLR